MPTIRLEDDAVQLLLKYRWPGNIRQLRNIAEQISVLEESRNISVPTLNSYLPNASDSNLPAVISKEKKEGDFSNEREILYKVLFDMKSDLNDLKKLTLELLKNNDSEKVQEENEKLIRKIYGEEDGEDEFRENTSMELMQLPEPKVERQAHKPNYNTNQDDKYHFAEEIEVEETLSLQEKEVELIKKSLERNRGKRKAAAAELGISERTLYRKIRNRYDLKVVAFCYRSFDRREHGQKRKLYLMVFLKKLAHIFFVLFLLVTLGNCGVYNFTGGNVGTAKSFQVNCFQNYATQSPGQLLNPGWTGI